MISERMLRKWRKDALHEVYKTKEHEPGMVHVLSLRILRMTQDSLDQYLIKK